MPSCDTPETIEPEQLDGNGADYWRLARPQKVCSMPTISKEECRKAPKCFRNLKKRDLTMDTQKSAIEPLALSIGAVTQLRQYTGYLPELRSQPQRNILKYGSFGLRFRPRPT